MKCMESKERINYDRSSGRPIGIVSGQFINTFKQKQHFQALTLQFLIPKDISIQLKFLLSTKAILTKKQGCKAFTLQP